MMAEPASTIWLDGREYLVAHVHYGQTPEQSLRIAQEMGSRLVADMQRQIEAVRSDLDHRLTAHEQSAAEAAGLAAARDEATAKTLVETTETLATVVTELGRLSQAVDALSARVGPLETAEEVDRRVRAELAGAHPHASPLIVVPQQAPAAEGHGLALGRWTPTHVVLLASIAAVVLTGATVDWAAIIQQLIAIPPVTP